MSLRLSSRATVYDRYAITSRFTTQETAINLVQGNIALLVSESEIIELKNGNKTMYSKLASVEVSLKAITMTVSSSEYKDINGVLSAITQARAAITLNSHQIELKVSKNNIVSSINQSAEAISINANKININGVVTANGNFKILSDGSMEAKDGKFRGSVTGGDMYLDSKLLAPDNTSAQIVIKGTGALDICTLSDSKIRLIDGNYFGNENNCIELKIERTNTVHNAIKMTTNVNGHPAISLNEEGVCKVLITSSASSFQSVNAVVMLSGKSLVINDSSLFQGRSTFNETVAIHSNLNVFGTKNRIVKTEHFGTVAQSAYETAEPMFGDMGHGVINEFGECTVFIDPKFRETVSTEYGYYVFITSYSSGSAWVDKKEPNIFTICGDPGMEFDWEIKAHQKGYEKDRLKTIDLE